MKKIMCRLVAIAFMAYAIQRNVFDLKGAAFLLGSVGWYFMGED